MKFGYDFSKWLICKRFGVWRVIPPTELAGSGAKFTTGTEALAAFAAGGKQ